MADPVTHILLGIAIAPHRPVLGAIASMLSDLPQGLASIKFKTTNIWQKWSEVSEWTHWAHKALHSVWPPLFALFVAWFAYPPAVKFVVAWLGHVVLDMFTHDRTAAWEPFVKGSATLGKTFHSIDNMKKGTWMIVLLMVGGSLALAIWKLNGFE